VWGYFSVRDSIEGTTLYIDGGAPPYLDWVWEIPIHPETISVGYVSTGDAIKAKRQQGRSVRGIYKVKLEQIPRFATFLQPEAPFDPLVTSFRCRGYRRIAGPNWLVVGEAASMVDPMTSNGVTAALRHAAEASSLIVKCFRRGNLPIWARTAYSRRVQALAKFFNNGIERVIYDWPVRRRIGVVTAGDVYTVPAWVMNVVYSRMRPRGLVATELFGLSLASLRAAAWVLHWICRKLPQPSTPIARAA
jgi:menaquinone-9 beta-reductase